MKPLTQYGRMAERHWREFRLKMVAELEAKGRLHEMLLEAEEKTANEVDQIRRRLIQQGWTPQQAQDSAWEIVRERYIFLTRELTPPRESEPLRNQNNYRITDDDRLGIGSLKQKCHANRALHRLGRFAASFRSLQRTVENGTGAT
ncbi:MAG: hypothetical protein L0Z50_15840 [Verrucomicrobiales bacterium]|nr:hypothetical protein [Verrucomicrobiales bacterium]